MLLSPGCICIGLLLQNTHGSMLDIHWLDYTLIVMPTPVFTPKQQLMYLREKLISWVQSNGVTTIPVVLNQQKF